MVQTAGPSTTSRMVSVRSRILRVRLQTRIITQVTVQAIHKVHQMPRLITPLFLVVRSTVRIPLRREPVILLQVITRAMLPMPPTVSRLTPLTVPQEV